MTQPSMVRTKYFSRFIKKKKNPSFKPTELSTIFENLAYANVFNQAQGLKTAAVDATTTMTT